MAWGKSETEAEESWRNRERERERERKGKRKMALQKNYRGRKKKGKKGKEKRKRERRESNGEAHGCTQVALLFNLAAPCHRSSLSRVYLPGFDLRIKYSPCPRFR